jgi:type VI secretion system protein ImpH
MKSALLAEGQKFSFIQAMRLLRFYIRRESARSVDEKELNRKIRVRPELSLNFPGTDLARIDAKDSEADQYLVTATFFGLYGASSPLPSFYTEDLLQERNEDRSITRDFLDIFNAPLYSLLFQLWGKYQLAHQIAEEQDARALERLYCLLGLESTFFRRHLKDPYRLLRYVGLAVQLPRSAQGLCALLSDALGEAHIQVVSCVERMAPIPEDQRLWLGESGTTLGEDSVLGELAQDRMGKFRICIGPCNGDRLHDLLPDSESFGKIMELIRFYLDQPLDWDLEVILKPGEAAGIVLGRERWSRLGWNTWLIAEPHQDETLSVLFEALPREHFNSDQTGTS